MQKKEVNDPIPTQEGGSIRAYFDGDSCDTIIEVWDPYSAASINGWVTLTLSPENAGALKRAL